MQVNYTCLVGMEGKGNGAGIAVWTHKSINLKTSLIGWLILLKMFKEAYPNIYSYTYFDLGIHPFVTIFFKLICSNYIPFFMKYFNCRENIKQINIRPIQVFLSDRKWRILTHTRDKMISRLDGQQMDVFSPHISYILVYWTSLHAEAAT